MAGKADAWMPFYVADYLRDTMRLTRDEHGAYLLLLMAMWIEGGELPNDPHELAAIAKATPAEWRQLSKRIMRFFTVDGSVIRQGRMTREVEKARRISDARIQSGAKGGRPKKQTESKTEAGHEANEEQTETHACVALPSPTSSGNKFPEEASPQPPLGGERDLFAETLAAFPEAGRASTSPAKAREAWEAAIAVETPARLLKAAQDFAASDYAKHERGRRVPSFHRWLTDRRFEIWLKPGCATPNWAGPPEIRAAIAAKMGEAWTVSYLDPCGWQDVPARAVIAPRSLVAERLRTGAGAILADFGAEIVREAA